MIIGSLNDTERLEGMNPHFRKVFEFLKSHDLQSLPVGKTEIDGDNVWLSVSEVQGKEESVAKLETHDQYIDIQLPLEGKETFGWQSRGGLKQEIGGYDAVQDIAFYADRAAVFFTLPVGQFCVFFPEDAHAPCIGEGRIKKIVVKVKV
ncbi:MAG: YhcH/YjgK/YiaL family protein [Odoribacter sp.]|nr:YhcH/YjgK/YiaL family protein [Odoribacter sp.]